jgi:hypothetical protein
MYDITMDLDLFKINVTFLLWRREQLSQWRVITSQKIVILNNQSVRETLLCVKLILTNKLVKVFVGLIIFITLEEVTNTVGFYNIRS